MYCWYYLPEPLFLIRFGEESMGRLIGWLEKQKMPLESSILDIGTGNGVLLVELVSTCECSDVLIQNSSLKGST